MAIVKLNLSGHDNQALTELGFTFPGALHVNLADPELGNKVAIFLAPHIQSGDVVTIATPGLAPLASIVITVIHGLCGQFPFIQPLVREQDGTFIPAPVVDLQSLRNDIARQHHRNNAVIL